MQDKGNLNATVAKTPYIFSKWNYFSQFASAELFQYIGNPRCSNLPGIFTYTFGLNLWNKCKLNRPYIELFRELKTRFRYTTGLVYITHLFWHLEAIGSKVPAFKNEFNSQELKPRDIFVALHPVVFLGKVSFKPPKNETSGTSQKAALGILKSKRHR